MPDLAKPWVLVRRDKPNVRFASESEAKRFYDGMRCNGAVKVEAVLFGPGKIVWRCLPWRNSSWIQDTSDRRKERADALGEDVEA